MKSTQYEFPTVLSRDSLVPLESVLCTEELNRRTTRPPDYEAENRALVSLVQELAESPRTILQALADKILEVFDAGSAGVSLLTKEDGGKRFYWPAIAGVWKPHIGGGTPRDFGPCGDVLDRNTPLMFRHLERRYTYFLKVTPPVEECLLVPFYAEGKAVGKRVHDKASDIRLVKLGPHGTFCLSGRRTELKPSSHQCMLQIHPRLFDFILWWQNGSPAFERRASGKRNRMSQCSRSYLRADYSYLRRAMR